MSAVEVSLKHGVARTQASPKIGSLQRSPSREAVKEVRRPVRTFEGFSNAYRGSHQYLKDIQAEENTERRQEVNMRALF